MTLVILQKKYGTHCLYLKTSFIKTVKNFLVIIFILSLFKTSGQIVGNISDEENNKLDVSEDEFPNYLELGNEVEEVLKKLSE